MSSPSLPSHPPGESPAEAALRESNELLRALSQAQSAFLVEGNPRDTFDRLLGELLRLTGSEYGFIGEILIAADGHPYVKAHAFSELAWDPELRGTYEQHLAAGSLEFHNPRSLFGAVMTTRAAVIANAPASDPRRGGLPPGHPPLHAFLGLPFERHGQMIGMVGLANRPRGYDPELIGKLEPFLATCAALTEAFRIERRRQHAERSLRESEDRLRVAMTAADIGTFHFSGGHGVVSDRTRELCGLAPDEAPSYARFLELVHPEDRERVAAAAARAVAAGGDYDVELRVVRPDGGTRWLAARGRAYPGEPPRLEGVVLDIGERQRAAERIADSERKYRALFESANDAIVILRDGRIVDCNGRAEGMFGISRAELVGRTARFLSAEAEGAHPEALAGGPRRFEARFRRPDGAGFDGEIALARVELAGQPHVQAVIRDVTERKIAERELRDARERLVAALRAGGIGVWSWDREARDGSWDETVGQMHGIAVGTPLGGRAAAFLANVVAEDRARVRAAFNRSVVEGVEYDVEYRVQRGGAATWIAAKGRIERDPAGGPGRLVGACVDITERKQLEEQLLHAQKMEAVGRLAGGVAHDFNNLLTVILGHAALLRRQLAERGEVSESVGEIAAAAERASNLTRQLLAFSRRQRLQLRPLSLNDVIGEMTRMLQRIVGEDVRFTVELAPGLPPVEADGGMVEQVLVNLVVNARDAMPAGGELRVRTAKASLEPGADPDAPPGPAVAVSVTDTGSGIAPEHLAHIFEPFFTTKDVGKGTGLGLATVYGIVKQHRGVVRVDTTPGRGSCFTVTLPASRAAGHSAAAPAEPAAAPRGSETVLVVEDEAPLRRLLVRLLTRQGYAVVEAASGVEALRLWGAHRAAVRLLLTDLVMPDGVSGHELAARLRAEAPGLGVIFTSGYSAEVLGEGVELPPGAEFIQKPFDPVELLRVVRRQLDG